MLAFTKKRNAGIEVGSLCLLIRRNGMKEDIKEDCTWNGNEKQAKFKEICACECGKREA